MSEAKIELQATEPITWATIRSQTGQLMSDLITEVSIKQDKSHKTHLMQVESLAGNESEAAKIQKTLTHNIVEQS